MDDHELILPPDLQSALEQYYTAAAPDARFAARLDEQLCRQHRESVQKPAQVNVNHYQWRVLMKTLRARPLLAILFALAALLVLSGIVYAVMHLAGFIPKVGFVNDVQSMLTTPITVQRNTTEQPVETQAAASSAAFGDGYITSQEQQGVTITIEQAVSEPDQLILVYSISGLPQDLFLPERAETLQAYAEEQADDPMPVQVRLPDGRLLTPLSGGHCSGSADLASSWLSCRSLLSPLPADITEFTLEISRLQNTFPGELPENWKIPISLSPVESGTGIGSSQEPNICSQPIQGITLCLLKTNQGAGQTAFQFAMQWEGDNEMLHHTAPITLQDMQNRYYILSGGPESGHYSADNPQYSTLPSMVTVPIDKPDPLTFQLPWVAMSVMAQTQFSFTSQPNGEIGQIFPIDKAITIEPFSVTVKSIRLLSIDDKEVTYQIDFEAPQELLSVNFMVDVNGFSSSCGFDESQQSFACQLTLSKSETQSVTFSIIEAVYRVNGPWQIVWQPQAMDFSSAPTAMPLPTRLAVSASDTFTDQPIFSEITQILENNFSIDFEGKPIWVKQVLSRSSSPPDGLSSVDTLVLPLDTLVETWTHINAQGYADTSITLIKSMQGEVLDSMIHHDQYYYNIPENFGSIAEDIYLEKPTFDQNTSSVFSGYLAQGADLSKETATCDAEAGYVYSLLEKYDPPMMFANESKPVQATEISVCVNAESNKVLFKQNIMRYADGTSTIKGTTRFLELSAMPILPDEIQAQLDRVIMP